MSGIAVMTDLSYGLLKSPLRPARCPAAYTSQAIGAFILASATQHRDDRRWPGRSVCLPEFPAGPGRGSAMGP